MSGLRLVAAAPTPAQRRAEFGGDHDLDEGGAQRGPRPAAVRPGRRWVCGPSRAARADRGRAGRRPSIAPALADAGYGAWTGRTLEQVDPLPWLTDPHFAPPGGESLAAVRARAGAWLDGQAGRDLVAVAHTTVVRALLAHALGLSATGIWQVEVAPLAVLRLTHRAGRWHLHL